MENQGRYRTSRIRRERTLRGAASVEAVVVLPVLMILLASVYYVRNQTLAQMAAETKARTCAWQYSQNHCDSVPPGCENFVGEARGGGAVSDAIETALKKTLGGKVGGVISGVLEPALEKVFGRSLEVRTHVAFERPGIFGGGTTNAQGSYRLACNLENEDLTTIAKEAWDAIPKPW